MKTVLDRSIQPVSLQPMFEAKGLLLTAHGKTSSENAVVALSTKEARMLAYALLAEAEMLD